MKKIALEEAVAVPGDANIVPENLTHPEFRDNLAQLVDVTGQRLRAMDSTDIEISVLSVVGPGIQGTQSGTATQRAVEWNDYLAKAVASHNDRFRVFAALPMQDPDAAVAELRRCVQDLGFVGALINGYDDSLGSPPTYYDGPRYLDFWRAAAQLDVPVYLHPRSVPAQRPTTYHGYPELRGAAWGFHIETAEHVLRLILSGLFDKVPDLRLVLGHLGELLPWWCWRVDHRIAREGWREQPETQSHRLHHTVTEYVQRNIYATTSGFFHTPALKHTIDTLGVEHVLYSVDYPMESCEEAATWFDALDLSPEDHHKIAHDNAASLLKIR